MIELQPSDAWPIFVTLVPDGRGAFKATGTNFGTTCNGQIIAL